MLHSPFRRSSIGVLLAIGLGAELVAQTTHTVGTGGFAQIGDAIAVAQPGDLILVQPGAYLPFDLAIGVRIIAANGATVTPPAGANFVGQIYAPAGQQITIAGLQFRTVTIYPPAIHPVELAIGGHVVFADCAFLAGNADYEGSLTVCNGDVQFDRCRWQGLDDCLTVTGGHVQLNDCVLTATWQSYNQGAARAIRANGGDLTVFSSVLRGSGGNQTNCAGSPAILLSGTARLLLADSSVFGGDSYTPSCGPPSSGVTNLTSVSVLHARCQVVGGLGGVGSGFPTTQPGPPFTGPEQSLPLAGGRGPAAGPLAGSVYAASIFGPTTCCVGLGLSFVRSPAIQLPFTAQPVHFDPAAVVAYQWGLISTPLPGWPGFGAFAVQTPVLTQAMVGLEFWLHPLVWDGAVFQVGPVLGGVVR